MLYITHNISSPLKDSCVSVNQHHYQYVSQRQNTVMLTEEVPTMYLNSSEYKSTFKRKEAERSMVCRVSSVK